MKTILLVRHGETIGRHDAFYGSTNVALSALGKQQTRKIVDELVHRGVQLVITSGLQRTDCCGELAAKHGLLHVINPALREVNFGSWEGMTWSEINKTNPNEAQTWLNHPESMRFPDGEDMTDVQQHIRQAWDQILILSDQTIAIVGHSGVLGYLLQYIGETQELVYMQHSEIIELRV